ncbi:MAG: hypothetical protein Q7S19_03925 [bacterium]|nr:hypothetical protein [bacterium]
MTLATHILIAGAVTKPFLGQVNNLTIFGISVFSHYLSDAIPHYDYKLLSIEWKEGQKYNSKITPNAKLIIADLLNISIDIAIGIAFLVLLTRPEANLSNLITYSLIIFGAILPDALQPIFIMWKKSPMNLIQTFHDFWHAKLRLQFNRTAMISQGALFFIAGAINYFY